MPNVLIIGSGGREHCLGWKLNKSSLVEKTFFASGNGGTYENISITPNEIGKIVEFAGKNKCFTVIGPEEPLSRSIVNEFESNGLTIFGPSKEAAELETSKVWSKNFMKKYEIRTAGFHTFNDIESAKYYVQESDKQLVIKADGLAAGKAVFVCNSKQEAFAVLERIMVRKEFGDSGNNVIIEERIDGQEASFIAMTDGKRMISLASSQDHKRIYDGDKGPNTGGMGACSPTPLIDQKLHDKIMRNVIQKAVVGMKNENRKFKGFIYAGLMIKNGEPYVLEFNVRMGDPECQPILVRMESDLFQYMEYCVREKLDELEDMRWSRRSAVCVVMASKGYPGRYECGKVIRGLDKIVTNTVSVFHSGTACNNGDIITNGGRVLGVTAIGDGMENSIKNAYNAVNKINWEGVYYRTDIGKKALLSLSNN